MPDSNSYKAEKSYLASSRASDYRATNHILTNCFAHDGRVWKYVAHPSGIQFDKIFAQGLSGGETRLLKLAQMLWADSAEYNISDILTNLDEEGLYTALEALQIRVGLRR